MKKKDHILDPLWITKGGYFDPEYFTYILLDANQKYADEIENGDISRFTEVFFHSLNLNNLAVEGFVFDFKLKPIFNEPRLKFIKGQLKEIYKIPSDTVEIFKNANYVFSNLILDYMDLQLDVMEEVKIFLTNSALQKQKEVFIVTNYEGSLTYSIWRVREDRRKNFNYSFKKISDVTLKKVKENALKEAVDLLNNPALISMVPNVNTCFTVMQKGCDETKVATVMKDIVILNKGLIKNLPFEINIISEMHKLIFNEKIMPFTSGQWI